MSRDHQERVALACKVIANYPVEQDHCTSANSPHWPGNKTCYERWPDIKEGWCRFCKRQRPNLKIGDVYQFDCQKIWDGETWVPIPQDFLNVHSVVPRRMDTMMIRGKEFVYNGEEWVPGVPDPRIIGNKVRSGGP